MIVGGVLTLAWAVLVWRWQDPFTALYTHWQQGKLADSYKHLVAEYRPAPVKADLAAERRAIRREATAFRHAMKSGSAIGRIRIGRVGLNMVLVNGTDHDTLTKGPGRDLRTFMPGENRLVYIAGHRTTYLAPFASIDAIRSGDSIEIEVPYATFVYRATTHRIVKATDLSVLRSPKHEQLELQACHPRFFASHRYILYAKLVRVQPRGGDAFTTATAQAARG
jgi:sortase A